MPEKIPKVKLGLKNLAMLSSYFDYIFVHIRQKVRLQPESSPKFLSTLGPNSTQKARPDLQLRSNCGKQKRSLQIFHKVSGVFQQDFNGTKNTAVLEPKTWQFSRTWGFKAKDLTFEAKAKDFKMCPWGQWRPRGLHLWLTA